MKKYLTLDFVIGLILMSFSIWFWILSGSFPEAAQMFPRLFLGCTIILSALMLINCVREQSKKTEKEEEKTESFLKTFSLPFQAYCIMILYIAGIRYIGFFIATTAFMLAFMYYLNVRKPAVLIGVTAGIDIFLYLMFVVGLKLSLPTGILF